MCQQIMSTNSVSKLCQQTLCHNLCVNKVCRQIHVNKLCPEIMSTIKRSIGLIAAQLWCQYHRILTSWDLHLCNTTSNSRRGPIIASMVYGPLVMLMCTSLLRFLIESDGPRIGYTRFTSSRIKRIPTRCSGTLLCIAGIIHFLVLRVAFIAFSAT